MTNTAASAVSACPLLSAHLHLAQVAVDQDSLFIVACALSNHPNDKAEAEPSAGGPAASTRPARRSGWLTSCVRKSGRQFVACVNALLNQSSASLRPCWAFASSRYAA